MFDLSHEITAIRDSEKIVKVYNDVLSSLTLENKIDEVAFLGVSVDKLVEFVMTLTHHQEVEHFNGAIDEIRTIPMRTRYKVQYEFLRLLGRDYRIEVMALLDGFSPLHTSWALNWRDANAEIGPIHASFKLPNIEEYNDTVAVLMTNEWHMVQGCHGNYGVFSYWEPENFNNWFYDGQPRVYLKPRCNLRDRG